MRPISPTVICHYPERSISRDSDMSLSDVRESREAKAMLIKWKILEPQLAAPPFIQFLSKYGNDPIQDKVGC
jgi:hypothetical protein